MFEKMIGVAKTVLSLIEKRQILEFSGSLAFFWFLAIFPGITFLLSFISYFEVSEEIFFEQLQMIVPGELSEVFYQNIAIVISTPNDSLMSLGAFLFLWSGSQGFSILITLTVQAYGAYETRSFFRRRGLAVMLMLLFSMCTSIIVSLNLWWQTLSNDFKQYFGETSFFTIALIGGGYVIVLFVMSLFISVFFKVAPEQKVKWKHVIPGSIFSIVFWQIISYLFSVYISKIDDYGVYGSLGGITISLVWLYLTGIILMLGIEINIAWSDYKIKKET